MDKADQDARWIEVRIKCDGELAEALADVLGRFVVNGVVIENETRFNPQTQENEPTEEMIVSGYLAADEDLEAKRRKLAEALWHLSQITPVPEPEYRPIHDQDWMDAWKVHYQPIPIGKKFLIMPAWKEPEPDETRTVIRINPAMAFGTGTHPSTQLCLQLLEAHHNPGQTAIDVGCGSGILAIAALKLGTRHVLAVDIDGVAVTSTLENAGLNAIAPAVLEAGKGSLEEIQTGRFTISDAPLVMVNILAPVIVRLFEQGLREIVRPRGMLLLSGLLDQQEKEVSATGQAAGFDVVDRLTQGDWVGLAMRKIP